MRWLLRLALGAARVTGWVLLVALLALELVERTGVMSALARESLALRLGPLGRGLELEAASLDLLEPALELEGLVLHPSAAGQGGVEPAPVRVEHARLLFASALPWSPARTRLEVEGGRVVLSPALLESVQALRAHAPERERAFAPELELDLDLRELELALELRGFGRIELGRAELVLATAPDGGPRLAGRLVPPGMARSTREGVHLTGGRAAGGHAPDGRPTEGVLELSARARELELDAAGLPPDSPLARLSEARAGGRVDLDLDLAFDPARGAFERARLRLALSRGAAVLPGTGRSLDSLSLALDAQLADAPTTANPLELASWSGAWTLAGRLGAGALRGGGRFGLRAAGDDRVRAWLALERLPLDLSPAGLLGEEAYLVRLQRALAPHGSAPLHVGLALRVDPDLDRSRWTSAVEVTPEGELGLSYVGFHESGDQPDQGFPLPVEEVRGRVLVAHDGFALRSTRVGVQLEGRHHAGRMQAEGLITSPPSDLSPDHHAAHYAELDLHVLADPLPVDARLEQAFLGLRGLVPPETVWLRYGPSGGELGADVRLVRRAAMRHWATDLRLHLREVDLRWSPLPVPLLGMEGDVRIVDDGQHAFGVGFAGAGGLRNARGLALAGRVRSDEHAASSTAGSPDAPAREHEGVEALRVEAEQLALTGDDVSLLAAELPGVAKATAELQPRGFVDLRYERVRAAPAQPMRTTVEVTAGAPMRLTAAAFPMVTSDVRGRVLLRGEGEGALETSVAPLLGSWERGVEVAFETRRDPQGKARIEVLGAGVDPASKSLLGSLAQALGGNAPLAGDALVLEGRLDLSGAIDPDSGALQGVWRFHLRRNRLKVGTSGLVVADLDGALELEQKSLRGHALSARLGTTPVAIEDARLSSGPNGTRLVTRFRAKDLPLDRAHLQGILNEATLDPLLDELGLSGRLDLADAELVVEGSQHGGQRVSLLGGVVAHDVRVRLGLPLEAERAVLQLDQLELENGRLRARATIDELEGAIAGRRLGPMRMLVTYVEPRLAIESLDGTLEGGRVRPLGVEAERGGTALSVDLVAPFPFQLALECQGVQLSGLLRDLFASNLAAQGTLDGRLRLVGDTENLLGLTGAGAFELSDSRLWSVPVFRALFSQLGLDDTATFDDASCSVRVRDGVIRMDQLELHSPLLRLVGSGTVDLDGTLHHELELRYSLLDWVGPLQRLVYEIQNRLLSVAIRGDLDRPRIVVRSPFTGLFLRSDQDYRALPLPGFTPPPARW